jgi:hypothetical protein
MTQKIINYSKKKFLLDFKNFIYSEIQKRLINRYLLKIM